LTAIGFAAISGVLIISALAVVLTQNLVRAVYWLALALLATAALYAMLDAGFLAGVQVLTYVGGVVTLMIFGVMVTRRHDGGPIPALGENNFRAGLVALVTFAAMASAIVSSHLDEHAVVASHMSVPQLAHSLLDEYLLAFEAASLLLLAAIVGAVVLARRSDAPTVRLAHGPGALPANTRVLGQGGLEASSAAMPAQAARDAGGPPSPARVAPAAEGHS
jgi:NADH-quinone oxidoreductase subunit J